jgi:hypothetical protein
VVMESIGPSALDADSSRGDGEAESLTKGKGNDVTESVSVGVRGRRSSREQVEAEGDRRGAIYERI